MDHRRAKQSKEWTGSWSCDDLTPDLCSLTVKEYTVEVRGLQIHYWIYKTTSQSENVNSFHSEKLPIIVAHGGPSWTHNYMLPLKQLACRGHQLVFYDQAGCGESTANLSDSPWLLDPLYYALEELPALIRELDIDDYHFIGNSWGTLLGMLYEINVGDSAMQSMTLSSPVPDIQKYFSLMWDSAFGIYADYPIYVRERIHTLIQQHAFNSEEYRAIEATMAQYLTRTMPFPDCLLDCFDGANREVEIGMIGPANTFAATTESTLYPVNVTGQLSEINIPVLLLHGKYDSVRQPTIDMMLNELPQSRMIFLEESAHFSMIDQPKVMNDAIAAFLKQVETGQFSRSVNHHSTMNGIYSNENTKVDSWLLSSPPSIATMTLLALATALLASLFHRQFRNEYRALP